MKLVIMSDDSDQLTELDIAYLREIEKAMGIASVGDYIMEQIQEAENNGY